MIKNRYHYWTCSKFADWIRGEKKPFALEFGQWDKWRDKQKKERPWRFWLSDTVLGKIQDFIYYPSDLYYTIRAYMRNRYISKIHYLKTGLKPGEYYDFDDRILYGLFNELVIFVEMELAHLSKWKKDKKYKFENGRCIDAAYDYFEWANNLKHQGKLTPQAKASRKIQQLYEWWTIERVNRPDAYSLVNWQNAKKFPRLKTQAADAIDKIEKTYEKEDTKMLIELIRLRDHLWT